MAVAVVGAAFTAGMGAAAGVTMFGLTVAQTAALSFAASLAMSFATSALAPKPKSAPALDFSRQAQDNVLTVRQAAAPRPLIFGRTRVGGVYTFLHTTGSNNNKLHAIVTVAGHAVRSFDALYLDDEEVQLDSNGDALGKYAGKIKCIFGLGTTAGDVDFNAELTADVGTDYWGSNHKQFGCAKAYIEYTYDSQLFGNSLPNASFVVSGYNEVYDPRTMANSWTDCAALCVAQYITETTRGLGFLSAKVNDTALIAAANDCDEMVTRVSVGVEFTVNTSDDTVTVADTSAKLRTGTRVTVASDTTLPTGLAAATNYFWVSLTPTRGQLATSLVNARAGTVVSITDTGAGTHTLTVNAEPRYTCNGKVDTAEDPDAILPRLLSSMAGVKTESGGEVFLFAGVWRTPVSGTLDENMLDGGVKSSHRRSRGDLFNGIKGTFVNPDDNWIPTDFPNVAPPSYLTEDGSVRSWRDAELPYTDSPSMAQRICRIDLEKNRRQQSATLPLTLAGMKYRAGDNIYVTNDKRGWADKTFFIGRWMHDSRDIDGENPRMGVSLDIDETDATVYAWTPGTDEASMTASPLTNFPDPYTAVAPTGLTLSSGTNVLGIRLDGTVFSRIKLSWTAPLDVFVTDGGAIEIEYKKSSSSIWLFAGVVRGDLEEAFILDVDDGVSYDVRIRSRRGALNVTSDWLVELNHTVLGKEEDPSDVTGFSAAQSGSDVAYKWDQVPDLDLEGYEIRYAAQGQFNWGTASALTKVTRGTFVKNNALPPGSWTLGIKARDTSKNYSTNASTFDIDVLNVNTVIAEIEEQAPWLNDASDYLTHWTGSQVLSSRKAATELTNEELFEQITPYPKGLKLTNLLVHWTGKLVPSSTKAASDLTNAELFTQFVPYPQANCYVEAHELDAGFDDSSMRLWYDMDSYAGPGHTDEASPQLQAAVRLDGGTYGDFFIHSIGYLPEARYVKPRLYMDTSVGVSVISRFQAVLDKEVDIQSDQDVSVGISGTSITFPTPFHTVPIVKPTAKNAAHYAVPSSITTTGFTVDVYDVTTGGQVAGTIDWDARGV